MIAVLLVGERDFGQQLDRFVGIERRLRQRAAERRHQLGRLAGGERRLVVFLQQPVDDEVDDLVAEPAHLFRLHAEGVGRVSGRVFQPQPGVAFDH